MSASRPLGHPHDQPVARATATGSPRGPAASPDGGTVSDDGFRNGNPPPGIPTAETARPGGPPPADLGGRSPWLILAVLCGAVFMLLLDTTIVNVAQQVIKEGLGASLTEIQWILDSYILAYAVLLLSFGRLGDVLGRKRMFVWGMAIFTVASALCGASSWLADAAGVNGAIALIFFRVLQGVGGALMMPQTLSLISVVFPPEKRGAAMGMWGSVVSLGAIVGPIVGGFIVTHYAWEWIFLINVPVGIAAILATLAIVPESRDPQASRRIDWPGVGLSGVGIFLLVFAAIEGARFGWTNPLILGFAAAGALLLAGFVWWEGRAPDPIMKLELFALRNFTMGNIISLAVSFGLFGIFFPMTLFLQGALGYSALQAGLTTAPMSVATMIVAPLSGRLSDRIGARWLLVGGLGLVIAGILSITAAVSTTTTWLALLVPLLVTGTGMGMTFAPMTAAAMAPVPPRIAGSASGILNTARNIGQVLGIAVLGSVLQTRVGDRAQVELAGLGTLSSETIDGVAVLVRDSNLGGLPAFLQRTPEGAGALPAVFGAAQAAFVGGVADTFRVGAFACVLALGAALLVQNPKRRPAIEAAGAQTPSSAPAATTSAD
jgi:EmrB/QacA subfamily drug resistance transporter